MIRRARIGAAVFGAVLGLGEAAQAQTDAPEHWASAIQYLAGRVSDARVAINGEGFDDVRAAEAVAPHLGLPAVPASAARECGAGGCVLKGFDLLAAGRRVTIEKDRAVVSSRRSGKHHWTSVAGCRPPSGRWSSHERTRDGSRARTA